MTNDKIIEDYFRALGWEEVVIGGYKGTFWKKPGETSRWDMLQRKNLPNIIDHYPDFKKWVIEVMGRGGYQTELKAPYWYWINRETDGPQYIFEEIKDNEITKAAVIAATRYLEEDKKDEH